MYPVLETLIARVLPFVTLAVLIVGLAYRIRKWQKAPVANMALYPAASSKGGLWRKVLGEVVFFSSFRKESTTLWLQTWVFHIALALIILGHTRLITDWPLRVLLGMPEETVGAMSAWAGGICGVVAMIACITLLIRRVSMQRVREISTGEDYTVMLLLLAILVTGNIMRFYTHFEIGDAQTYFATLFTFVAIKVPADSLFLLHYFLVQVLLIYLPFGKFLHIPGVFYSKALIARDF